MGNLMKCPQGSPLMLAAYEEAVEKCNKNTKEWLLTNKILNKHIKVLGLEEYIAPEISNQDNWQYVAPFIYGYKSFPNSWHFIHWMNEEWRRQNLSKNTYCSDTVLASLLKKYNIPANFENVPYKRKKALLKASPFYLRLKSYIEKVRNLIFRN